MCYLHMYLLSILDTFAEFQKYPLDKSPVLISVRYEIRACLEKFQKINKRADMLIPYNRVQGLSNSVDSNFSFQKPW